MSQLLVESETHYGYKNLLIAGGASTVSHSIVWLPGANPEDEIAAFLCSNHVQIYERRSKRVEVTLKSQEERLDCIAGLFHPTLETFFILTGSAKGTVNVWTSSSRSEQGFMQWQLQQTFTLPSGAAASCVALTYLPSVNMVLAVAGDAKGHVHIYRSDNSSLNLTVHQKLLFPSGQLPNSLHFATFVHNTVALVIGGVDAKIHLYIQDVVALNQPGNEGQFRSVGHLWGHEEWVTCLDAVMLHIPDSTTSNQAAQEVTFLASGSQDNKIRIWKIVGKTLNPTMLTALGLDTTPSVTNNASTTNNDTNPQEEDNDDDDDDEDDEDMGVAGDNADGKQSGKKGNASTAVATGVDTEDIQDAEARLFFTNSDRTILYQVFLESLLIGHEDWVTSLAWMPISNSGSSRSSLDNIALFSTSMDRNMVIWCPNAHQGGVWTPLVRVGDVGGALGGSIGGNLLGFVAGCAAPDGQCVLGVGYGGSFHCWTRSPDNDDTTTNTADSENQGYEALANSRWVPKPFVSGHFDQVTSLSWASVPTVNNAEEEEEDTYLLTASADQTCRLYVPVLAQDPLLVDESAAASEAVSRSNHWKEVSRPLIHGYNLNAVVPRRFGSGQIIVASDEKIIRHFAMSRMVQECLGHLAGVQVQLHPTEAALSVDQVYIPELGLSNKPKELMNSQEQKEQEARNVSMIDWQALATNNKAHHRKYHSSGEAITDTRGLLEAQLADYTVWLEVNKWYGHAYDVLCLSQVSRCGRYVASACRAKFAQTQHTPLPNSSNYDLGQAGGLGILVWELPQNLSTNNDTNSNNSSNHNGEIIARLEEGHEMSVVSLEFAPNGRYLASCGKDRSICLHVKEKVANKAGKYTFVSVVAVKNAHKRIIWDASWTADSRYLLTGSRDGALKIWSVITTSKETDAETAEDATPSDLQCIFTCTPFTGSNPSVTALDVYHFQTTTTANHAAADAHNNSIIVVVGGGSGEMQVLRLDISSSSSSESASVTTAVTVTVLCEVPVAHAHTASVRKVMWRRPSVTESACTSSSSTSNNSRIMTWASCSEDHTVRIHQVTL